MTAGKRWPGPWTRLDDCVVRSFGAPEDIDRRAAVFGYGSWSVHRDGEERTVASGTATEAEAMAAADEALFQMLVGVGPWLPSDVDSRVSTAGHDAAHAVSDYWRTMTAGGVTIEEGYGLTLADGRLAADAALRRLAGYDDATDTPIAVPEPAPAPRPPEPPAPAGWLAPLRRWYHTAPDRDVADVLRARRILRDARTGWVVDRALVERSTADLARFGFASGVDKHAVREARTAAAMAEAGALAARRMAEAGRRADLARFDNAPGIGVEMAWAGPSALIDAALVRVLGYAPSSPSLTWGWETSSTGRGAGVQYGTRAEAAALYAQLAAIAPISTQEWIPF